MTAKKCSVIQEEVIDVFHEKMYIPTIEKLSFHLANVGIIGSINMGILEMIVSMIMCKNKYIYKVKDRLFKRFRKTTGI